MSKMFLLRFVIFVFILMNKVQAQSLNTLTEQEKKEGWQLLLNGKDLKGWHSFREKAPGKAWQVENGAISLKKNSKSKHEDYKDLVTDMEFDNFDLKVNGLWNPAVIAALCFM